MHRLRSIPEVTLYIDYLKSDTEEETKIWVQGTIHHNFLKPRQSYNLAITRRPDGQVIGWIGIGQASGADAGFLDFGYALLPAYWRQGYATEALAELIDFSFEQLNPRLIFGECDPNNLASARVMEKVGLLEEVQVADCSDSRRRFVFDRSEWRVGAFT